MIIFELFLNYSEDYYEINALYHVLAGKMDEFDQAVKEVLQFYPAKPFGAGAEGQAETNGIPESQQQFLM